jgi:hypothetical protein
MTRGHRQKTLIVMLTVVVTIVAAVLVVRLVVGRFTNGMRYIALIVLALALAACGCASHAAASHAGASVPMGAQDYDEGLLSGEAPVQHQCAAARLTFIDPRSTDLTRRQRRP